MSAGTRRRRTIRACVAVLAAAALMTIAGCSASSSASTTTTRQRVERPKATPTPTPVDPVAGYVEGRLASMTLEQKIGSLLMLHSPGTDGTALRGYVDRYGLGGLILMGDNIPGSPADLLAETQAISSDPGLPVLIGTDEEGGDVTRLGWDTEPGADRLKAMPAQATADAFTRRATLLKQSGVNVNFGVIADVTSDPNSFIYDRVLGTDPASSSERVSAAVGAERGSVLTTLKHFPGHGETEADSHLTIPTTAISYDEWAARDAPSFSAGIGSGAQIVMFGHLVYSAVDAAPASLSPRWHQILHDTLGFHGITITDDMRMLQDSGLPEYQNPSENAIRALAAGNTMLLFVTAADPTQDGIDPATIISDVAAAVRSGRISQTQIDADVTALLTARRNLSAEAGVVTR